MGKCATAVIASRAIRRESRRDACGCSWWPIDCFRPSGSGSGSGANGGREGGRVPLPRGSTGFARLALVAYCLRHVGAGAENSHESLNLK